jgi:PAS domain S-box-containing protein
VYSPRPGCDRYAPLADPEERPITLLYVGADAATVTGPFARRGDRFDLIAATTAAEALDRLSDGGVDCVASEYDLPDGDGLDLFRTARASGDVPFVLLGSGEDSAAAVEAVLAADGGDYVPACHPAERAALLVGRVETVVERRRTGRAMERRTRRLETLISNLTGVVYRCRNEPGWPMEFLRGDCEALTGYPAEALERGDVEWGTDLLHPDDREEMWAAVQAALAAEEPFEVTYRIRTADGEVRWVRERGRGVYDDGEDRDPTDPAALEGFIADVTTQKHHERELRRLKEEYRVVFEHARDSLFLVDVEERDDGDPTFRIRQINPANEASLGVTNEAVRGRTHADLFGDDADVALGDQITENYRRCFERRADVSYQERLPVDDGVRTFETTLSPVTVDGEVTQIVGVAHDVTAREERERQLASLHEASRDLMAAETPSAVARIAVEASESVLSFTNTTVRLLDDAGTTLRPVVASEGSVARGGARPDYAVDGEAPAARAFRTAQPVVVDDLGGVDDGYDRGSLRSGLYVPIGGHGVVSVGDTDPGAFDESDVELVSLLAKLAAATLARIQSQTDLRARNERLSEFASIVSHDLRNPLNVAQGRLELVREECDSRHVQRVADAHGRMRALIDDLLALAREGETVTAPEPTDLARVVESEWDQVETGDATLVADADLVIRADRGQLRRLVANLVRNSVEHAAPDGRADAGEDDAGPATDGSLRVRVGALDDGFFVEDDGRGIPPDRREAVFEAGHTTSDSGSGFGLAIVDRIAEGHGWTVEVAESAAGGARFEFTDVEVTRP